MQRAGQKEYVAIPCQNGAWRAAMWSTTPSGSTIRDIMWFYLLLQGYPASCREFLAASHAVCTACMHVLFHVRHASICERRQVYCTVMRYSHYCGWKGHMKGGNRILHQSYQLWPTQTPCTRSMSCGLARNIEPSSYQVLQISGALQLVGSAALASMGLSLQRRVFAGSRVKWGLSISCSSAAVTRTLDKYTRIHQHVGNVGESEKPEIPGSVSYLETFAKVPVFAAEC